MFLKQATLTGFKSFAAKTVLELEPGITAIVGPNGSGKSNLADAVRWALGEQAKGRLRLSDREEVIFAGTTKRAKASFAEVVLLFDNQDGAFPLDLTEVEISRRLYRSGETDYRLAGRKVRLSDIQALLAQAGFGAGTYAVIGQGMIDSLLLSPPAERKELFDEAAGIRAPELGREAAQRKLAATDMNLARLRDIASELAPRLASLERSVAAAGSHKQLEQQLLELRGQVVAAGLAHWAGTIATATTRLDQAKDSLQELQRDQDQLGQQLTAAQAKETAMHAERDQLQQSLTALEHQRDQLTANLADQRAAMAKAENQAQSLVQLETQIKQAARHLKTALDRQTELETELASTSASTHRSLQAVERSNREVTTAQAALVGIRQDTTDGTRDQYLDHALQILKTLAASLTAGNLPREQVRLLVYKVGRLLKAASRDDATEIIADLAAAQKRLEVAMTKRETTLEHQTNITITARSLEIDLTHQRQTAGRASQHLAQLQSQLSAGQAATTDLSKLQVVAKDLTTTLVKLTAQVDQRRHQLRTLTAATSTTQNQVELTGRLERCKAAIASAKTHQTSLLVQINQDQAQLAAVHTQAKAWGLTGPADSPVPRQSLPVLQEQLTRAEAQFEAHTATQLDQTAELQEVSTRHAELTRQITDLETARADLAHVITELDTLIRTRFKANFQALAEQFGAYFSRLFNGGTAALELTETADGAYGISIKASPAGKRLTSVAALSGGERALAGVALLAAILRVNPSPFVVLDEIDAALDEANSGRLAAILGELAQHSQLILITHNRQTMRAARVLFGVTINEHHISHMLSIRLEQAAQLAAR